MNKKAPQEKSIFDERKALLELWKTLTQRMEHGGDLIWRNVQYFFVLISAMISANLIGLPTVLGLGDSWIQFYLLLLFPIFPVLIIALSFVGWFALKRRFKRMLEIVAHLGKIEGLLDLNADISERLQKLNLFPKDTYLFERHVRSRAKYRSEEEFINSELEGGIEGTNMYTDMKKPYWLFIILGIVLILVNTFLIGYVYVRLVN